ncbi:MAG: sigma 54-interacting transcriptional regulator [Syntrophorhabdaceae bacterium]|nr:sigma 54-interacting transcriptional regulator [Syntrophorhabdaceae bacterium]
MGTNQIHDIKQSENSQGDTTHELKKQMELYRLIFDNIYNGLVVVDKDGYIILFNKPYGQFLGVDADAQIGKHVTEVIENTRMHHVIKSGKPEINVTQRIMGQDMVVQRIPIKKNGTIIGALGQVMFKDVSDVRKLANKLCLLESKVKLYEEELISLRSKRYTFDSIVGVSQSLNNLKQIAQKAATTNFPVLITGESGTGKEMFAQAIHNESTRRLQTLVRINCAAIPKELLESELFGYEKGAFTGAHPNGKLGKLELANNGTVFLDEIGDLPFEMQPKLLRVLEDKEFERVGGTIPVRTEFRIIAASNQNLEDMIHEGRFRKDLFYRLNVIRLHIPPLRERREDIIPIAEKLLKKISDELSIPDLRLEQDACDALIQYDWPGNTRELSNVLERVVSSYIEGNTIRLQDLPPHIQSKVKLSKDYSNGGLKDIHANAEIEAIQNALRTAKNNKSRAAELLGIHRTLLYKKMKKYNIISREMT